MNIKKNYFYNIIYQVITMLIPLITVPYISRVLKPEGVGIYAYTNSVVQYFILFAMLGIGTYGNKKVAITREDKNRLSKNFLSIYYLQIILSFLSIIIYLTFIYSFYDEYIIISLIQTISLLATAIDCTWLFNGLEDFKKIVIRNIFIKIISLAAIFLLVKDSEDLLLYTFILALSSFMGQLIMWINVKKYITLVSIDIQSILKHVKPSLIYFLPQVATQIYFVANKTMLGAFSTIFEVGIYDYADKILKLAVSIVTILGVVMLPRMSHIYVKGETEKAKVFIIKSLDFSTFLAIAMMFGTAGIARELIPWYMGEEFYKSSLVLIILSPTIFFLAWSSVFGSQYLVPLGKMGQYTTALYLGAIINLILNLFLIRNYGAIGAAVSTLVAELIVMIAQLFFIIKDIGIKPMIYKTIIYKIVYYFISGFAMYYMLRVIGVRFGSIPMVTLIQIITGFIIYILCVLLFEIIFKKGLILDELKKRKGLIKEIPKEIPKEK